MPARITIYSWTEMQRVRIPHAGNSYGSLPVTVRSETDVQVDPNNALHDEVRLALEVANLTADFAVETWDATTRPTYFINIGDQHGMDDVVWDSLILEEFQNVWRATSSLRQDMVFVPLSSQMLHRSLSWWTTEMGPDFAETKAMIKIRWTKLGQLYHKEVLLMPEQQAQRVCEPEEQ